jgi:hypothetical protein
VSKPIQRETFRGLEATGYSSEPSTWPQSQRSQQRFTRRRAKQQSQSLLQQIQQENKALQNKDRQIGQSVQTKVKEAYGFLPSSKSIFQNACYLLRNMSVWYYFARPTNLAFHDLTPGKVMPSALKSLLGLSMKFIPTPKFTTHHMMPLLDCFQCDLIVKTY